MKKISNITGNNASFTTGAIMATQYTNSSTGHSRASLLSRSENNIQETLSTPQRRVKNRRSRIPDKPHTYLNLWSVIKSCVGKDLTKIPFPVNFSEPLSMLQRLTEDFEYSEILDRAAKCQDTDEQLALVAAFTVSSYSTTSDRTTKPFNPLLGETYECDRMNDLGWRAISEQVSHHPPTVAQHCQGGSWTCWQQFTMTSKFRGKYISVFPTGIAHLKFGNGNHYTWRKVTTTVHNIIIGKLWVDNHGEMDIVNHTDGSRCHLTFVPQSYFSWDTKRKVTGYVRNKQDKITWIINGTWDSQIVIAPAKGLICPDNNTEYELTGPYKIVWERNSPPPGSELYYNFSLLACQLNEPEHEVAPTDSRNRPDQRLMEEGRWEEANKVKSKQEDKQRTAQREREKNHDTYEPAWFKLERDETTDEEIYTYQNEYWNCKRFCEWDRCPDIFVTVDDQPENQLSQ